jgi:hypothetical protein
MPCRVTGRFATRREAELAVEHLVQEYGIDRAEVAVTTEGLDNTAGVVPSGTDTDPATGEPGASARHGLIIVAVTVADATAEQVRAAMQQAGAR